MGNVAGAFTWDIGGAPYTFTIIGEEYTQIAGGNPYTIRWDGTGSLLFNVHSIPLCPNNVSGFNATLRKDLPFVFDSYVLVKINGGTNNTYIPLYTASNDGSNCDKRKPLWGEISNTLKTSNGYISSVINGNTYYIPRYSGDISATCSSNLIGTEEVVGTFKFINYVFVLVNGDQYRYVPVYEKL